jgi:hypothetical protein
MEDLIKREDAVQMLVDVIEQAEQNNDIVIVDRPMGWGSIRDYAEEVVSDIPSAEPWDTYNFDEWCTDCKEYDTENHRCPRWNKVIRRTLEENPPVVNCVGCVHWVNDVANPDRMMCKKLKIPTEDFFFCGWGEREGADNE